MTRLQKQNTSLFLIWLFTVAGIIGINSTHRSWFLAMTPMDLLLYLGVIIWTSNVPFRLFLALCIPFFIGFFAEFLGANYGYIFGNYTYGQSLGIKIAKVPLMIGVNWATLVYCTAAIASYFSKNKIASALIGAGFMVGLDVLIEVSAPKLDFWEFDQGIVPFQNYLGWLGTALLAHLLFQKYFWQYQTKIAVHIFMAMLVFFTFFYFNS